jgi:hypothetical protein
MGLVAWVVGARGTYTYGDGIKTPTNRRFPFRLPAALVAWWFNRRYPNPSGGRYSAVKLARGECR